MNRTEKITIIRGAFLSRARSAVGGPVTLAELAFALSGAELKPPEPKPEPKPAKPEPKPPAGPSVTTSAGPTPELVVERPRVRRTPRRDGDK